MNFIFIKLANALYPIRRLLYACCLFVLLSIVVPLISNTGQLEQQLTWYLLAFLWLVFIILVTKSFYQSKQQAQLNSWHARVKLRLQKIVMKLLIIIFTLLLLVTGYITLRLIGVN